MKIEFDRSQPGLSVDVVSRYFQNGLIFEQDAFKNRLTPNLVAEFLTFISSLREQARVWLSEGLITVDQSFHPSKKQILRKGCNPSFVARMYDQQAVPQAFAESEILYRLIMSALLETMRLEVSGPFSWASICSGIDFFSLFFIKKFGCGKAHLVDLAPKMHELVRRFATVTQTQESLATHVSDACAIPVESGSLDCTMCFNGLHWIKDKPKAISEMKRMLNPKGSNMIYILHVERSCFVSIDGCVHDILEAPPTDFVLDLLESQGFSICLVRQFNGEAGTGQFNNSLQRSFIAAKFTKVALFPWRSQKPNQKRERITT